MAQLYGCFSYDMPGVDADKEDAVGEGILFKKTIKTFAIKVVTENPN